MQKNLVLAIVLSSAVYILWYSFIEKKPSFQQTSAPAAQTLQTAPAAGAGMASASSGTSATAAGPLEADWASHAVELKLNKATYTFHPAGASIKSLIYQGPVAPVELVKDPAPGFLSSFDDLHFALKTKTSDSVTFEARAANGVIILKKFILNGEDKINLLEITAVNPSSDPAVFPAWNLKVGPGLGTVKSEEKENPKLWKAQYTVQEEGKKFPTIKTIKENQKAGPWIWAGVNNRYFLAAVLGGDLKRDSPEHLPA